MCLCLQPVGFVTFNTRAGAEAAKQDLQVRATQTYHSATTANSNRKSHTKALEFHINKTILLVVNQTNTFRFKNVKVGLSHGRCHKNHFLELLNNISL